MIAWGEFVFVQFKVFGVDQVFRAYVAVKEFAAGITGEILKAGIYLQESLGFAIQDVLALSGVLEQHAIKRLLVLRGNASASTARHLGPSTQKKR